MVNRNLFSVSVNKFEAQLLAATTRREAWNQSKESPLSKYRLPSVLTTLASHSLVVACDEFYSFLHSCDIPIYAPNCISTNACV